jgi:hypothetical protein
MNVCGMLFHSCIRARRSSSKVSGGFKPFRTRRPSSSLKCLTSFTSGDNAAMEGCGYDCHLESPLIHGLHDSEHYHVERRD